MKTENPVLISSVKTTAAITKNLFINFNGGLCANSAKALGVSNADADLGEELPVMIAGIALVYSGAAITLNANGYKEVISDGNGKAREANNLSVSVPAGATAVTSTAAQPNLTEAGSIPPESINGYAMDAATGADQLIRVRLL